MSLSVYLTISAVPDMIFVANKLVRYRTVWENENYVLTYDRMKIDGS